jgi:alpha-ribazole phosphatase
MRLHLIRHAQPQVGEGICYGRTDLRVHPREQERLLSTLPARLPHGVPMFTSPLRRCATLADRLSRALGAPTLQHDIRLAEMDFGAWEMQAWNAIPRAEIDAWVADLVSYEPGGGESVLRVAERIRSFLDDLQQRGDPETIVVCHAGTIRLMRAFQEHAAPMDAARAAAQTPHAINYGALITLDC